MRRYIFVVLFVLLFSVPVMAADYGTISFSTSYDGQGITNYANTLTDFVITDTSHLDSADDVKLYAFTYDDTSGSNRQYIFIVSNAPFTCTRKITLGADSNSYSLAATSTSSWPISSPSINKFDLNTTAIGGYYGLGFAFWSNYPLESYSNVINLGEFPSYSFSSSYVPFDDNFKSALVDYFFQLPPTLQREGETEILSQTLLGFLASGIGLVILLIALLVLVTVLVRYLRRCLTL